MKQKVVLKGEEAREKLLKGANFGADAVKSTLGPYGQNAVSGLKGQISITNDGKTIAQDIQLEDEIENLGWRVLKEASLKADEEVGDGTTTAVTLAQAILNEMVKYLKAPGTFKGKLSAIALTKQVAEETEEVLQKLTGVPVLSREELIAVVKVSVEDDHLAELIGGTQWNLGPEGTILPEKSNDSTDSIEPVKGVRIDNGFGTSLLINNLEKGTLEVQKVKVILTNHTLNGSKPFLPLTKTLEDLAKMGVTDLVIVARAFSSEAIQLAMENYKAGFRIYPVNAPYQDQTEVMKDLAAITGAKFIDSEDRNLESMQLSDVGFADKLVASRFSAVITGKEDPVERIAELQKQLEASESPFERKNIQTRLAQLTNGFALLKVGANSTAEREYKFDKVTDAVNSAKTALQEGTVKGAGLALKEIAEALPATYILKRPLMAPYEQIMENAGETFDIPDWVRDPVKVVRVALQKASSVASQLATANIAYDWKTEKPKDD